MQRILSIVTAAVTFLYFFSVAAAQDVTLLSPLPGTGPESNFGDYVPIVFNLSIGIAAILAVVMIIMGGLQYMSTDAIQGKSDGKNRITAALLGLGLALAAYVILWQINPNLVRFELNKLNVGVTGTPFTPTVPRVGTAQPVGPLNTFPLNFAGGSRTMSISQINTALAGAAQHMALINQASAQTGIPAEVIQSMIAIESGGRVNAVSPLGAVGVMQLLPTTAQGILRNNTALATQLGINPNDLGAVTAALSNPATNIAIATTDLARVFRQTGGNIDAMVAFHNAGPDALAPSVDCPGLAKFQCGINPGGLQETINFINNLHAMQTSLRINNTTL